MTRSSLLLPRIGKLIRRRKLIVGTGDFEPFRGGLITGQELSPRLGQRLDKHLSLIDRSQKFNFDSGVDRDEMTTQSVRETAVNMLEARLFHLPYPVIWVEDPFPTVLGLDRRCYLCIEHPQEILIYLMRVSTAGDAFNSKLEVLYHLAPIVIDLADPGDDVWFQGYKLSGGSITDRREQLAYYYDSTHRLGEAAFAVKRLIVTLNATNTETERHPGRSGLSRQSVLRDYAFTTIRVPHDVDCDSIEDEGLTEERRMGLVRGYVWGKNTRPLEQQRWVKPFWRGSVEMGIKHREEYIIVA